VDSSDRFRVSDSLYWLTANGRQLPHCFLQTCHSGRITSAGFPTDVDDPWRTVANDGYP
jgi:hypothetical protein